MKREFDKLKCCGTCRYWWFKSTEVDDISRGRCTCKKVYKNLYISTFSLRWFVSRSQVLNKSDKQFLLKEVVHDIEDFRTVEFGFGCIYHKQNKRI